MFHSRETTLNAEQAQVSDQLHDANNLNFNHEKETKNEKSSLNDLKKLLNANIERATKTTKKCLTYFKKLDNFHDLNKQIAKMKTI